MNMILWLALMNATLNASIQEMAPCFEIVQE